MQSMSKTIEQTDAQNIALSYVAKQEMGAQGEIKSVEREEIWLLEVGWPSQSANTKGTQFAEVIVSGAGEIVHYEKTQFRASMMQRIASKLRAAFSHDHNRNADADKKTI
jgi:hypothetical protein